MGCSTLRSNRALRVRLFGLRASLRTLSPDPATPPPSRECGRLVLPRARSTRPLDLAFADVRKMLPHSPLQSTQDTSTRDPFVSRARRAFARPTTRWASGARLSAEAPDRAPRSWRPTLPLARRIEPRVDMRLTAPAELRPGSFTAPASRVRDRSGRRPLFRRATPPHRGVVDHVRG